MLMLLEQIARGTFPNLDSGVVSDDELKISMVLVDTTPCDLGTDCSDCSILPEVNTNAQY